ncbi:MAG: GxxExxY protein [Candidatus Nealsonbacteria bacterium]|nr:GxxExxY protein [Candidatus Nealsonbacteria bacterium]
MTKLIYPDLSYKITGLLFQVHNKLGRFRKEKYYCNYFENMLKVSELNYEREKSILLENQRNADRVDFCIEGKILIDFKNKKFITKTDYFQMINYLKALNLKLGLIVNFRNTYLKPKRVVNLHLGENYDIFIFISKFVCYS